ncbi:MAG TPA: oligosaccharide flippase family protein [Rhizomicrobium sp.]|jgi:O-antigen/teichoic acid export membrane protein|nr:oligosaccharide flippase family protein [Rhizomicrobium sp.]
MRPVASHALKDVSKLLSGSLLAKLFGIASLMLFARVLTKSQMAIFPAYLMLAEIPNLILTLGIFSTFTRRLPSLIRENPLHARSLILTGSALIVAGTILPSVAAFYWSDAVAEFAFKNAADGWIIRIMVPGFIAYVFSRIVEYVMWGRGQFGATSILQIIESVVRPLSVVSLYLLLGYRGIAVGLVLTQLVLASVGLWYVRDVFARPLPPIYPIRELIWESMPYYIGNYLSYLRGDGDNLLVTALLGPTALAEYYVAKTLYTNLLLLQTAIDKVALQRLAQFVTGRSFVSKVIELYGRIAQTTIPFMLLAVALAPCGMVVLAGSRYADATWPAILLLVALLVQFVTIPVDRAVFVGVPGYVRVGYAVFEAVAVVSSVALLVPFLGLAGVAAARIIAPTCVFLFGLLILHRRLGLVLPVEPAMIAVLSALPGTIFALFLFPHPHSAASALAEAATIGGAWSMLFLILSWILDRQLVESTAATALRWCRTAFPSTDMIEQRGHQ